MENTIITTFKGFNPFIKQLRTDRGWRVEFDVDESQYDLIKDLPKLEGKVLNIKIYGGES